MATRPDSIFRRVSGETPASSSAMISATQRALSAGIAAAEPGARVGDIAYAIGSVLTEAGYPINTEFGGHGVGSTIHQDPHIPNTGWPGRGYRLRPGLLLALEPWVMADTAELVTDADGWTLRSATGCRTAHSEHTIAITNDGADILTLPAQVQPRGRSDSIPSSPGASLRIAGHMKGCRCFTSTLPCAPGTISPSLVSPSTTGGRRARQRPGSSPTRTGGSTMK
ncbi:MAG: Methionine aminopeptidase [uncultured Thermomicrobiales bacterium]|uniref:Methionine aminopeptidase n=1 Tax=uncultured Thermomicrobiales bacterium TaxID=1645740 RepID=A0A6J4UAI8_9BACT|nr:MAG: Methionine aminopeptidase [uncultured Thermomicrobiales bacterium]